MIKPCPFCGGQARLKKHYKLEQTWYVQCHKCGIRTLISRQAVMNCFKKWQPYMATRLREFETELLTLPPVAPELKSGHWVDITNKNGTVIAVRCSCCGQSPKHAIRSDFCPRCGSYNKAEGIKG